MINKKILSIVLVASLAFLGGCQKASYAQLKKNHPISFYDDSQEIDNVRVSCKRMAYDSSTDCTLIKLSIDNQTDTSCMFGPTDINLPLITHENAQRIYDTYNNRGKRISQSIGYGIMGFLVGSIASFPLLLLSGLATFGSSKQAWNCGAGAIGVTTVSVALGGLLGYRKKIEYNPKSKSYFSQDSSQKVIFGNEQDAVMLCVQGRNVKNLDITLHSQTGTRQFGLRLKQ